MTSVNRQDKVIYIHIPKCARSSIEKVDWLGGAGHVTYRHLQNKYTMKNFFVFTSVRNPLDRLVSAYHHFVDYPLKPNESQADQNCYKMIKRHQDRHKDKTLGGFPAFINKFPKKLLTTINHFRPQRYFLEDNHGNINIDYIMTVRELQVSFNEVCIILDKERCELSNTKTSTHLPYEEYYNTKTCKIVRALYKDDYKEQLW